MKRQSVKKASLIPPDIKLRLMNAERVQAQRSAGEKRPPALARSADRALFTLTDLEFFPKYLRTKAIKLLDELPRIGVRWNARGEITYNGILHPGTHVFRLVDYAIRPPAKRKIQPLGVESFMEYLTDRGILSPGAENKLVTSPARLQAIANANNRRKLSLPANKVNPQAQADDLSPSPTSSVTDESDSEFQMSMQYPHEITDKHSPIVAASNKDLITFNRYK